MTTNIADLVARLRAYRPPSADMSMPREHHPICDTAATALEDIARERDEARRAEQSMRITYDVWRDFYKTLSVAMEADTPAEAKVKRQARLLSAQAYRLRCLRSEVRRLLKSDPYKSNWPFTYAGMIRQNGVNFAKFKAAEAEVSRLKQALEQSEAYWGGKAKP